MTTAPKLKIVPEPPKLLCIPAEECSRFFPGVMPFLAAGAEAVGLKPMPAKIIIDDLTERRASLWVEATPMPEARILAAMLTRMIRGKNGLVCKLGPVGGEALERWCDHIEQMAAYAKANGCVALRIEGREGWERALPGFDRIGVILERAL